MSNHYTVTITATTQIIYKAYRWCYFNSRGYKTLKSRNKLTNAYIYNCESNDDLINFESFEEAVTKTKYMSKNTWDYITTYKQMANFRFHHKEDAFMFKIIFGGEI